MKSFFNKFYIPVIALTVIIGFFMFSRLSENNFYSKTEMWQETYRSKLKEDGFTSSQVNSIISSAERPAKLAFESINRLYVDMIILLIALAVPAFFKILQLERAVKELKNDRII